MIAIQYLQMAHSLENRPVDTDCRADASQMDDYLCFMLGLSVVQSVKSQVRYTHMVLQALCPLQQQIYTGSPAPDASE